MRLPVTVADFNFIPIRKEVTVYFQGVAIYEFSATHAVTKEAQACIQNLIEAYNTKNGYVVACRRIREVYEQVKFPVTYANFDAYVKDWPEAEDFRAWVTNSGRRTTKFIQITGDWNGLPGGYYWVCIREYNLGKNKPFEYAVGINDNDDGSCAKDVASKADAEKELEETLKLAPTNMQELCQLAGFQLD